jgi:hypothetical protein
LSGPTLTGQVPDDTSRVPRMPKRRAGIPSLSVEPPELGDVAIVSSPAPDINAATADKPRLWS